jgi:predicted metal-dependent hydrolase
MEPTGAATGERSEVLWGTTRISFAVRRSARRKTVSLAVDARDGLVVTAPANTPAETLGSVVHARARWVVERLRQKSALPSPPPPRELVSGEGYRYLGRQLRLRLLVDAPPAPVILRQGWLELPLPAGLPEEQRRPYARAALVDWYRRLAASRLPEDTARWAQKLGVAAPRVIVSEPEKRWGSCSKGVVRLNWRILQAPVSLIDYVVAHEVTHLLHEDHSRTFWATLGRVMPDYEARKVRLRELGPSLVW